MPHLPGAKGGRNMSMKCTDCGAVLGGQHSPHCHRQGEVSPASDYGAAAHNEPSIAHPILDDEYRKFMDEHFMQIAGMMHIKELKRIPWRVEIEGRIYKFSVTTYDRDVRRKKDERNS
jgi:hypothetical protein